MMSGSDRSRKVIERKGIVFSVILICALMIFFTGCLGSANQPPECSILASPNFGDHPLDVTFTMGASDLDGSIESWSLDVEGDGTPDHSGQGGPPQTLVHQYAFSGDFTPTLEVVDDGGKSCRSTVTVSVL